MDRLKNKAALITGAGAGIGAATARLFCAQGARVCLLDANPQALRDTQAKLLAEFPQASVHTAQADIADEGQAQAPGKGRRQGRRQGCGRRGGLDGQGRRSGRSCRLITARCLPLLRAAVISAPHE